MLQRSPTNHFQRFAREALPLGDARHGPDPNWPPDNANTIKSRLRRAQAKLNRRDPVAHFRVSLKRSQYNRLIADFEKAYPIAARSLALDDTRWRDVVGQVIIPIMLKLTDAPATRR